MPATPGFEERHGLLRFQVAIGGQLVDAFISRATCQADESRPAQGTLAAFYWQHRPAIDAVVRGKLRSGLRRSAVEGAGLGDIVRSVDRGHTLCLDVRAMPGSTPTAQTVAQVSTSGVPPAAHPAGPGWP